MQTPTIEVNRETLTRLLELGASFFPVEVRLNDNGKCIKKPKITEWQKHRDFYIKKPEQLNGHYAYGFHPEQIGAYVIDLDKKGDKDGEAELKRLVGDLEEITNPQLYVDSPNGRHLYFRRAGLPAALLVSRNGVCPGIDLRGDYSGGWLVAPGSIGYSDTRQDWTVYQLEGELSQLPTMPQALIDGLLSIIKDTPSIEKDTECLPPFLSPATPETMLPEIATDPKIGELFALVSDLIHSAPFFDKLMAAFLPAATLNGDHYETGDYSGNKGSSCRWTRTTGIIKDFADPGKGGDFLWWVERRFGILPIAAARMILDKLHIPDPSGGPSPVTIAEAAKAQATASSTGIYPLTDSGNAERLMDAMGDTIKWNVSANLWMEWDGKIWKKDEMGAAPQRIALARIRALAQEAVDLVKAEPDRAAYAEKIHKWAIRSESAAARSASVSLASMDKRTHVYEGDFDKDLDSINTESGIVDLRTGLITPHNPAFLCSQLAPTKVSFDPPSRFLLFLGEITEFDDGLAEWLHVYLGHCLTGRVSEQIFPIWWGSGANGKSVLLEIVGKLMGEYCQSASIESWLTQKNQQNVRDDLASMRAARLVWASEPDPGRSLSLATVKKMIGGEEITCRHLYGRQFSFYPKFKTIFVTNHRPQIHSQDDGIWRRIRFIPFTYKVPEAKRIRDLAQVLLAEEGPEIFGWLVQGAMKWYELGQIPVTPRVELATAELKLSDDLLADFISDKCILNPAARAKFDSLWTAYRTWNDEHGVRLYASRVTFRGLLGEKSALSFTKYGNLTYVTGIGIKEQLEKEEPQK